MSGVRKTQGESGIILQDPNAISRTGVRRMQRSPKFRRTITLHPRHAAVPPALHHSELGRRARIFGTASQTLQGHRPQQGHPSTTWVCISVPE